MPIVRINEPISDWREGDFAQGFALVTRKETRQDRKGRDYIDLDLTDATGTMSAKIWPDSPAIQQRFDNKGFVAFKGTVRQYRDQLQLNLDQCRQTREADRDDGFDEANLIPTVPGGIAPLRERFDALYPAALERAELQLLCEELVRRHGEALWQHPAAKSIHHAYRGGLLEHVVQMAEVSIDVCRRYPELDRDLLLLGVLLHDLGKLREIGAMPNNDYTLEGQLVGHITIGCTLLREACDALEEAVPKSLRMHLEHLILSHHGRREYGSPMEPATPEAFALHWIDNLDSKLQQLRDARNADGPGLHYLRPLGRTVYFDPSLDAEASASDPADPG